MALVGGGGGGGGNIKVVVRVRPFNNRGESCQLGLLKWAKMAMWFEKGQRQDNYLEHADNDSRQNSIAMQSALFK